MSNLEKERELFLNSKIVNMFKFKTLEYEMDGNLVIFKDSTLTLMWHAWLASINRQGYVLVPVEPTQEMIQAARKEHEGAPILPYSFYKAMIDAAG